MGKVEQGSRERGAGSQGLAVERELAGHEIEGNARWDSLARDAVLRDGLGVIAIRGLASTCIQGRELSFGGHGRTSRTGVPRLTGGRSYTPCCSRPSSSWIGALPCLCECSRAALRTFSALTWVERDMSGQGCGLRRSMRRGHGDRGRDGFGSRVRRGLRAGRSGLYGWGRSERTAQLER